MIIKTYLISLQELDNDELRPLSSGAPNQTSRNQNQLIWLRYFSLALYPSSVKKPKKNISIKPFQDSGIQKTESGRMDQGQTPDGQYPDWMTPDGWTYGPPKDRSGQKDLPRTKGPN